MTDRFSYFSRNAYSDLALESTELLRGEARCEIPGVRVTEESRDGVHITRVVVQTLEGATLLGKPVGNYVTIEAPGLRKRNRDLQQQVGEVLAGELSALLRDQKFAFKFPHSFLVVGLGNWRATADSLGPKVVSRLLVTRHLKQYVPSELINQLRSVSAIAPGVLGLTGIETGEIIRGIVEKTRPEAVIAIDSLSARSVDRIITTVQLADTGIHPGSGVGNKRVGLTFETLGVPVVAIGVPTVVHAVTIADNTLEAVAERLGTCGDLHEALDALQTEDRRQIIEQTVTEKLGDLVVTPKEIDNYATDMAHLIAGALNVAFHPGIDTSEFTKYIE
jgi:spore protease